MSTYNFNADFGGFNPIAPYSSYKGLSVAAALKNRKTEQQPTKYGRFADFQCYTTPTVAIDVECVIDTSNRNVPIKMSIVNEYGYILTDIYIDPGLKISNWNTQQTGITAQTWYQIRQGNSVVSWSEAQDLFHKFVNKRSTLVGHCVRNDLAKLNVTTNAHLVDTQMNAAYSRDGLSAKPSLKRAIHRYFGINIQTSTHSSLEDARASMLLYRFFF